MTRILHGLTREFAHGRAFSEVLTVSDPAAGASAVYDIGSRYWERIAAVSCALVTDGNAANRRVVLEVQDQDGVPIAATASGGDQAASTTREYSFLPNVDTPNAVAGTLFLSPSPDVFMQPGWSLSLAVANVQAGDQLGDIRLYLERFDTGPDGYPIGMIDLSARQSSSEQLGN